MKVLFDTSVLVAASVEAHPMHGRALPWLQRAHRGEVELHVASHSLAECYGVLTTLPVRPRIAPATASRLIRDNIESSARIVSLAVSDYTAVIHDLAQRGLAGGIVYDALIAAAARKSGVERLITLNPDDFERAWPEGSRLVFVP